jgi:hypothetical protein
VRGQLSALPLDHRNAERVSAGDHPVDCALVATLALESVAPVLALYAIAAERFVEIPTIGGIKE